MAHGNGITFRRDGQRVTIEVDLDQALAGRTSTGRPGSFGSASIEHGGHNVALNLNVFTKKAGRAQAVTL